MTSKTFPLKSLRLFLSYHLIIMCYPPHAKFRTFAAHFILFLSLTTNIRLFMKRNLFLSALLAVGLSASAQQTDVAGAVAGI